MDFLLQYLRQCFATCYYCTAVHDFPEELARRCVKHVRRQAYPDDSRSRNSKANGTSQKSSREHLLIPTSRNCFRAILRRPSRYAHQPKSGSARARRRELRSVSGSRQRYESMLNLYLFLVSFTVNANQRSRLKTMSNSAVKRATSFSKLSTLWKSMWPTSTPKRYNLRI